MSAEIRAAMIESLGETPVVKQIAQPQLDDGQVLIRMRAAALNFADLLKAQGRYQEREDAPFIPGLEGAGEVVDTAPGTGFAAGDRVAVNAPGTLTEVMAAPATACLKIPDVMPWDAAAGFQIAYGTSHLALIGPGALRPGDTLVVLGAAGGVGLTAVQVGHALGARVIAIARGAEKMDFLRENGADLAIDSDVCPDLRAALRDAGGVDVVYDPVGDEPGLAAFGALHRGGRFLLIGFAGGKPPALPLNHALVKNIAIHGYYWGGWRSLHPTAVRESLRDLFDLYAQGKLRPHTGSTLPLERVSEGYQMLRDRRAVGKVIIEL